MKRVLVVIAACLVAGVSAWSSSPTRAVRSTVVLHAQEPISRRFVLGSAVAAAVCAGASRAHAQEEDDVGSIVERASKISKVIEKEEEAAAAENAKRFPTTNIKTAYDFQVPVQGEQVAFQDLVGQTYAEDGTPRVKAILVTNIKQDDPIARKDITELISLGSKYGLGGEFVVVCSPTDQGYFEPDTSALLRLKLSAEYGYSDNPALTLTDKMNLLGSSAHPFWRWLEGACRTPTGLGRIEANFEKFLMDGRTGLPLRRYPRKFDPFDMKDDIEALLVGKPLPPVGAQFLEEWRTAAKDGERDTYRFEKGINWYDQ